MTEDFVRVLKKTRSFNGKADEFLTLVTFTLLHESIAAAVFYSFGEDFGC